MESSSFMRNNCGNKIGGSANSQLWIRKTFFFTPFKNERTFSLSIRRKLRLFNAERINMVHNQNHSQPRHGKIARQHKPWNDTRCRNAGGTGTADLLPLIIYGALALQSNSTHMTRRRVFSHLSEVPLGKPYWGREGLSCLMLWHLPNNARKTWGSVQNACSANAVQSRQRVGVVDRHIPTTTGCGT